MILSNKSPLPIFWSFPLAILIIFFQFLVSDAIKIYENYIFCFPPYIAQANSLV